MFGFIEAIHSLEHIVSLKSPLILHVTTWWCGAAFLRLVCERSRCDFFIYLLVLLDFVILLLLELVINIDCTGYLT